MFYLTEIQFVPDSTSSFLLFCKKHSFWSKLQGLTKITPVFLVVCVSSWMSPAALWGHHNPVMSIAPVNTRLIVHTPHCCPPALDTQRLVCCNTRCTGPITQLLSHTYRETHAGKETNRYSESDGNRLKGPRSSRYISHNASCCFGPSIRTLTHSQQTAYTGNEANPSPDTHKHTHGRHRHLHSSPSMILTSPLAGHCGCCDELTNVYILTILLCTSKMFKTYTHKKISFSCSSPTASHLIKWLFKN